MQAELQTQGFTIVGVHTNRSKYKKYGRAITILILLQSTVKASLTIGVEVKNTISMMDKEK